MRNSTMEYKVNQAYEELNRLIQWHSDSEEKFLQKMICLLLPGQTTKKDRRNLFC